MAAERGVKSVNGGSPSGPEAALHAILVGGHPSEAASQLLGHLDLLERVAREALHVPGYDLRSEVTRPFARMCVATDGVGLPRGFVVAWLVADELQVLAVVVRPEHRQLGVGRALVLAALADARAAGASVALLEVRRSNVPAIRLYRSLGFVALGVRRGYYQDTGEDAIELVLALEPGALSAFGDLSPFED